MRFVGGLGAALAIVPIVVFACNAGLGPGGTVEPQDAARAPVADAHTQNLGEPPDAYVVQAPWPPCSPYQLGFGTPDPLRGLKNALEAAFPEVSQTLEATLTDDRTHMMFVGCPSGDVRASACDIYEATLVGGLAPEVQEVRKPTYLSSTTEYDRHPTLSPDGKRLFLVRGPKESIYVSYRVRVTDEFPAPVPFVSDDNPSGVDTDPFFGRDGRIYFVRNPLDGVGSIYSVDATSPSIRAAVSLGISGMAPVVDDENAGRIFLAQLDVAQAGSKKAQIRRAVRVHAVYTPPDDRYVELLNDDGKTSNVPSWVSSDKCQIYFTHSAEDDSSHQVWVARRPQQPGGP